MVGKVERIKRVARAVWFTMKGGEESIRKEWQAPAQRAAFTKMLKERREQQKQQPKPRPKQPVLKPRRPAEEGKGKHLDIEA